MSETTPMSKAQLLDAIDAGWNQFQNFLMTLTYEQVMFPTDPAGWTAKDHITHLAAWEDSLNALLAKKPRWETLGVDEALFTSGDWDTVNEVVRQQYKDISLGELRERFFGIHQRMIDTLKALPEAELERPYKEYQPNSSQEMPIRHWFEIDTYQHYAEHTPWIAEIAAGESGVLSKATLLAAIGAAWDDLNAYLNTLTPHQRTELTDAAGWTVKDHVIHLAMWENGIYGLLSQQSRIDHMGIDAVTWDTEDTDHINAVIRENNQDLTWDEVETRRHEIHQRLIDKINDIGDEGLQRPYKFYDPTWEQERPIINWISGNTFAHYAEHRPWIQRIAEAE